MHPEHATLAQVSGNLAPLPFLTRPNALARLWRWLFPDTSGVKPGTFWLEKRPTYVGTHGYLYEIDRMTSDGEIFLSIVDDGPQPKPGGILVPSRSSLLGSPSSAAFVRRHRPISKEHARQLGFRA